MKGKGDAGQKEWYTLENRCTVSIGCPNVGTVVVHVVSAIAAVVAE
jgi:hypothetical protein